MVASKLFETLAHEPTLEVEGCLADLLGGLEPVRSLEILLPALAPPHGRALALLRGTLSRMTPEVLEAQLSVAGPVLLGSLERPEVRESALVCLAEMHGILGGEQLRPYLVKNLTPRQLKLVTVHIERSGKLAKS